MVVVMVVLMVMVVMVMARAVMAVVRKDSRSSVHDVRMIAVES